MSSRYREYQESESLERSQRLEEKKQSERKVSQSQKEIEEASSQIIREKEHDLYQRSTRQTIIRVNEKNPVSLFSSNDQRNFLFSPLMEIEVGATIDVEIYHGHKSNPSVQPSPKESQSENKTENKVSDNENNSEKTQKRGVSTKAINNDRDILLPMRVKSKGDTGELSLSYIATIYSDNQEKSLEVTAKVRSGDIFGKETVTTKVLTAVSLVVFDGIKEKKFFSNGWNPRFTQQVANFEKIRDNSS